MGDRTYVSLYIPTELLEQAMPIIEEGAGSPCDEGDASHVGLTFMGFEECNYGRLDCEEGLIEAGIPYTKRWDAGCEYTAGEEHVRFTADGELASLEVYDEGKGVCLGKLEEALADDADPLAAVQALVASHRAATIPLPWDNQAEYGRRYVAAQQEKQQ